jgi:diguanylate cyclase (GGDEF)-like protein
MSSKQASTPGWLSAALSAARGIATGWQRKEAGPPPATPSRPAADPAEDTLTGLPTRVGLAAPMSNAFDVADLRGKGLSLLYLGLDGFRAINDGYGHDVGDRVLVETARRLRSAARSLAPLARIAGDEFIMVVPGDEAIARETATFLLQRLARPCTVGSAEIAVTCSIGVAHYPRHGTRHQLTAHAVTAMRVAKQQGGGAFVEYDPRMGQDLRDQQELARDLRLAVEHQQLELFYQPKIDAESLQVTAAEALLRWHHPKRGIVSPALFIPIAERHRLIGSIGNWVVEEATRQAAAWRDRGLRMRVAINVSGYQMRQDDFAERLEHALRSNRLQPARFTCEITETVAMEDTRVTLDAFEHLRRLGVHVSIDDFGTGHSSLATLRRLPAAELKIDRAFVADIATSAEARSIVAAIVQMAHSLGLRVVAEGVETTAQSELLVKLGVNELQGYLFARPMSARALGLWAADDDQITQTIGFRPSLFKETSMRATSA